MLTKKTTGSYTGAALVHNLIIFKVLLAGTQGTESHLVRAIHCFCCCALILTGCPNPIPFMNGPNRPVNRESRSIRMHFRYKWSAMKYLRFRTENLSKQGQTSPPITKHSIQRCKCSMDNEGRDKDGAVGLVVAVQPKRKENDEPERKP